MIAAGVRLRLADVRKRFGATQALAGVSLTVAPGEIHALIGENGAGKSTLMKILSGAHAPDSGTLEFEGRPYAPTDPLDARRQGVAMGCVGFPVQTREPGACWTNPAGIHVVTAFTFPDLLRAGWELCPDDYPFRQAAPCTAEQLQATEAATSSTAPRLRIAADGSVITEGSGSP